MLARDRDAAESIVQTLCSLAQGVLLQEVVGDAPGGRDLRVVVVGGVALAAMERRAARESFRANVHRGGRTRVAKPGAELEALALASASALGLGVAGVDIVADERGPAVLEVNASPGFEAIERVTGINVARATIVAAAALAGAPSRP
jgi:ribosomal protein S6--L-glutamate ligase